MMRAALVYARLGWPVFPCQERGKRPLGELVPHGLKDATTDAAIVGGWWQRYPAANVAVATGQGSGIFVVDVDGPEGERVLADLERHHGALPDLYPLQWTGSGNGWQGFFSWPEGREIRNSAGRLGPKIDTRGEGGYVVLPPSIHASGNRYRWATDRDPRSLPPEPAPAWLIDLLDPAVPPEAERPAFSAEHHRRHQSGEDRYALKAFETELKLTARAPEGERNEQLFGSAFALLRLVEAGRLSRVGVIDGLTDAARTAGLAPIEISRTLASAAKRRGLRI